MALGAVLTQGIFSVPRRTPSGRADGRFVLRINSLSTYADYSYGIGIELIALEDNGLLLNHLQAPYAKILPKTLGGRPRIVLLLQALDRDNQNQRWGPEWTGSGYQELEDAQVTLDIPYEDFLLIAQVQRGLDNFMVPELFAAGNTLDDYGYLPEVFKASAISRIAEPICLLPLIIVVLIVGWRYRAKQHPQILGIPMLVVLPVVFTGGMYFYRTLINALSILMALSLSIIAAMAIVLIGTFLLFILTLILLAAQHG
jgi:hypothetical protein